MMKVLKTLLNVGFVIMLQSDVKARDYLHITGKYRGYTHRDCSIKVKLNHENYFTT